MVVGIDLDQFSLLQGQTLYQGKASIDLAVYDMKHGKRPVYQKMLPQQLYPPNAPIPAAEKSLVEFRRQFLQVLAEQIGRHFYEHDSTADFAIDSAATQVARRSGPCAWPPTAALASLLFALACRRRLGTSVDALRPRPGQRNRLRLARIPLSACGAGMLAADGPRRVPVDPGGHVCHDWF